MNRSWPLLSLALAGIVCGGTSHRGVAASLGPRAGAAAPAFLLETDGGDDLTLQSFAGKPLVLNVFASWCPPCRRELPGIVAAARSSRGRIAFLGVDEQEPHQMGIAFAKQMHVSYPVVFDHGQFAATYGAASLPVTIFIDARGRIGSIHRGAMSPPDLARGLTSISASTVTPART